MMYRERGSTLASSVIHPEHGESRSIVSSVRVGGIVGGIVALFLMGAVFVYMHINAVDDLLTWYRYIIWAIASMTLVFASAIVGMLVGVLFSSAQSRVQQVLHQKEAIAGVLLEIGIRKRIRRLMSL